jgi:hypothetical protein
VRALHCTSTTLAREVDVCRVIGLRRSRDEECAREDSNDDGAVEVAFKGAAVSREKLAEYGMKFKSLIETDD